MVRAYFADFDDVQPEPIKESLVRFGLTPHMIVESSPGKWHVYWRVYGASVSEFSATQARLAAVLGSDPIVKDLPRVMRLPGFPHQKDGCAPSMVRIVLPHDGPKYHDADFQAALAAAERHATSLANAQRSLAAELAAGLRSPPDMTQGFPDGQRTHELTKRAGWCLGPQRMGESDAVVACLAWNCHNTPPLPEEKVRATVASIAKSEARKREAEFHPINSKLDGKHSPAQSGNDSALLATSAAWHENTFSAADLRTMTFEPVRYVLPRFIPEGMTLLVGRPKVGKSWWVLDLCLACAAGHPALGTLKAVDGDVLYLALEDGKRRLQRRLDKLLPTFSGEWPERLNLVPMGGWHRADQGGLEDIGAWCRSVPKPVLVVVDTLERIRKPANGKAPLYSADYEAVTGLQKIALEYGIALVVLHHDRKSDADDAFDTVSGTLGLTGAADTILIIKRRPNGAVLYARGRDIEKSETAMLFDKATCRWSILGAASEVLRSTERARVIAALEAAGQPLSVREIMADGELLNRNAADILLGKMARDGEIVRIGHGRYDLSSKNNGQIGQKGRFDAKHIDIIEKSDDSVQSVQSV